MIVSNSGRNVRQGPARIASQGNKRAEKKQESGKQENACNNKNQDNPRTKKQPAATKTKSKPILTTGYKSNSRDVAGNHPCFVQHFEHRLQFLLAGSIRYVQLRSCNQKGHDHWRPCPTFHNIHRGHIRGPWCSCRGLELGTQQNWVQYLVHQNNVICLFCLHPPASRSWIRRTVQRLPAQFDTAKQHTFGTLNPIGDGWEAIVRFLKPYTTKKGVENSGAMEGRWKFPRS